MRTVVIFLSVVVAACVAFPGGVTRVGMYVGGKPASMTEDLVANLTAYDADDDVILAISRPGVQRAIWQTFVGIDADEYGVIHRVDLLYTGADQDDLPFESIDDLVFE